MRGLSLGGIVNTVVRPWEARFEPIVSSVKEHVEKIRWLADVGHIVISARTQQMTKELEYGQANIYQAQLLLGESQWKMHVEQRKHTDQMQALSEHFEKFLQINGRPKSLLDDEEDMSTGEIQEATVGKAERSQIPSTG